VAPRPGFGPGSYGRQPHILFRQHERIRAETGLYYLGLSAARILIALAN